MDKTEIMSPVKSFWNIFQEKILNSHRFLSDKVGTFSTFFSAVFAWYYFTKFTNKFQFVSTDLEKIGTKKETNSVFTLPYMLVSEEIKGITTGNSGTSKVCNEHIKSNKENAIIRNWSGICSNIYSDEEMESLARKYDDNYKEFWKNTVIPSANEKDTRKSETHLNDNVVPKFKQAKQVDDTEIKSRRTGEEKGDNLESLRDTTRPHTISKTHKWNEKKDKNVCIFAPSFASMPIFKDEDKKENKRKRYCKMKRPSSSSHKDRKKKENVDPNLNKKQYRRSLTDSSFQKFIKRDVTQVVAEKLKKEKERHERIDRMKKDRDEMLAKVKANRKLRAEMVKKTREQLALKEAEEQDRKKNLRMMRESRRKAKEIATSPSYNFKLQNRSSSRSSSFSIFCNSSSALDTRQNKQKRELFSPTERKRYEKCLDHPTETQTKDDNSIGNYPSLHSQKNPAKMKSEKIKDMFTDENLINETSKAFQKLLEAVKLYEKDTEPDDLYGPELYNHCKNELGKYKALVEELKILDTGEIRRSSWKNAAEDPSEQNKVEIIIHKKINLELPIRKEIENTA